MGLNKLNICTEWNLKIVWSANRHVVRLLLPGQLPGANRVRISRGSLRVPAVHRRLLLHPDRHPRRGHLRAGLQRQDEEIQQAHPV